MENRVIISTAPCSWGVWYADGRPSNTPWELFLNQAAETGYKELEMGPDGYLPVSYEELRAELDKRGLNVCAGTACYQFDQFGGFHDFKSRIDSLCERLVSFDAKYLVTMDESDVGSRSEKKAGFPSAVWEKFFTMLRELGAYTMEKYGVETVFHPHLTTMVETEEEIERMMEATGLALAFDIGHHAYANYKSLENDRSAQDFMLKYPKKIKYLHFKNLDPKVFRRVIEENLDTATAFDLDVMCDLEDGIIDYKDVKATMDKIGFKGIGVIEQDMPLATNEKIVASARRNINYLKSLGMFE